MNSQGLEKILHSRKYRDVCPDTVRRIWAECVQKYRREKEVEKAVREQLHGITGAFWNESEYRQAVQLAQAGDWEALLALHASTRERLPLERMDEIYNQIWSVCGAPVNVLDLACGLNPLYLSWRHPQLPIRAVDINGQCVEILRNCGCIQPQLGDLLCEGSIPRERCHIALLLKVLPLLERQRHGAARRIMERIPAQFIVVSFPTRSLSGRNVGMLEHYAQWMQQNLPQGRQISAQLTTENELFYILKEC